MDPKFLLGQIVSTPAALQAIQASGQDADYFLSRHTSGDWGEIEATDAAANDAAIQNGGIILSAYRTLKGVRLWVHTAEDRSVTTLMLPEEY